MARPPCKRPRLAAVLAACSISLSLGAVSAAGRDEAAAAATGLEGVDPARDDARAQAHADALAEAMARHARGDHAGAGVLLRALARRGVAAAEHNLGVLHLEGGWDGASLAQARRHFERAAGAGFVTAMLSLGQLHERGALDGPQDLAQAVRWYRAAAEAGSVAAMVELATAHYLGRGAARDAALAAHWYREAAKGGDLGAMYLIASMYEAGEGVPQDLRLARYWYGVAADQGDEAAAIKARVLDTMRASGA